MSADDWWDDPWPGLLLQIAKEGEEPRRYRAEPEDLQTVLDKAWKAFGDPTKRLDIPARFPSDSNFRRRSSRQT